VVRSTSPDEARCGPPAGGPRLNLLGGCELLTGDQLVIVPMPTQRLLAMLALHERPLLRGYLASTLWPDSPRHCALANLRSALRPCGGGLVRKSREHLQLAGAVTVDYRDCIELAHRLLAGADRPADLESVVALLGEDLLPDWPDEWVEVARQAHHQLRIHALEALSRQLLAAGQSSSAVEVALAAVTAEPLRESAHHAYLCGLIAEGNRAQAIKHYAEFRAVVVRELAVFPSFRLEDVLDIDRITLRPRLVHGSATREG
jgi:DNA-binding SARP family transcriptional activator